MVSNDTKIATTHSYSVKNVKTFTGSEGAGFECSIYNKGKKIGTAMDPATGGPVNFFINRDEEDLLDTYCKTLPRIPWEIDSKGCKIDKDIFVWELVESFLTEKKLKQKCKKKTIFTLKDSTSYWSIKCVFSQEVKKHLMKKHGDNLKEIVNERFV